MIFASGVSFQLRIMPTGRLGSALEFLPVGQFLTIEIYFRPTGNSQHLAIFPVGQYSMELWESVPLVIHST